MSSSAPRGPAPDVPPPNVRPLPPRPNLEYERKQAKRLLQQIHQGDPEALQRAREQLRELTPASPDEFRLSDAQFTIAREYGFTSWPRLVEYYTTLERHERSGAHRDSALDFYESQVRSLLIEHRDKRAIAGALLATFVPRFFGRSLEAVFASPVTIDEARLAVARINRLPSWGALVAHGDPPPRDAWTAYETPERQALLAVRANDLEALERIVGAHPELLQPADPRRPPYETLAGTILIHERRSRTPEARRITNWLVSRGIDISATLNWMLLGHFHMKTAEVAFLLERGADPAWIAPNGLSVLEHALVRYWNGEAVDLIASRVVPRKAFWIAAGVGDLRGLDEYIDRSGALTDAARRVRPDFTAVSPPGAAVPGLADADDQEIIWEAFFVAALNGRLEVLDELLTRGFPIDYSGWGSAIIHLAVGNQMVELVEFLVARGANLDLKTWRPHASACEIAESRFRNDPSNPKARRILELCRGAGRAAELLSRARSDGPLAFDPPLEQAIALAQEDARRLGQDAVQSANLFVGLLRAERSMAVGYLGYAGLDLARLRAMLGDRLMPQVDAISHATLPLDAYAVAALEAARTIARERLRETVRSDHLFYALISRDDGPVAELLRSCGGSRKDIREVCARAL